MQPEYAFLLKMVQAEFCLPFPNSEMIRPKQVIYVVAPPDLNYPRMQPLSSWAAPCELGPVLFTLSPSDTSDKCYSLLTVGNTLMNPRTTKPLPTMSL